eukprot:TRINITY_DN1817_c0_g1_i1.p1 TRINITY_DN1817_c0_g1~~TRINITY_DN1817_c0_g1_i1.p1  ORF type:complete len:338 (-),score=37.34 TRINITY_DN1817_c0_g1_i1:1171-2184(-)
MALTSDRFVIQTSQQLPYGNNAGRVSNDVINLLKEVHTLQPMIGQFTINSQSHKLLKLGGTIAIYYKGAEYNIPVGLYFPLNYPNSAPLLYVEPTKDMDIKKGHRNVNERGFVSLPYLSQWTPKSSLIELAYYIASVFSEDPPVYKSVRKKSESKADQSKESDVAKKKNLLTQTTTAKLQDRLRVFNKAKGSDVDRLYGLQTNLFNGDRELKSQLSMLQQQHSMLTERLITLNSLSEDLTKWITEMESKKAPGVDEIVYPRDTWSQQLIDNLAEDAAIEDTMFAMDRALGDERIVLKPFMKQIRKLASKQFTCRALTNKIIQRQLDVSKCPMLLDPI